MSTYEHPFLYYYNRDNLAAPLTTFDRVQRDANGRFWPTEPIAPPQGRRREWAVSMRNWHGLQNPRIDFRYGCPRRLNGGRCRHYYHSDHLPGADHPFGATRNGRPVVGVELYHLDEDGLAAIREFVGPTVGITVSGRSPHYPGWSVAVILEGPGRG